MKPREDDLKKAVYLLSHEHDAAIATLEAQGPYVSAAGFLYEPGGEGMPGMIFLLLSDLARHTRNLKADPRISLLAVQSQGDLPIHERKRVTVEGTVKRVEDEAGLKSLRGRYLKAFPRAEIFLALPDFHFYEIRIRAISWIGGFGQAAAYEFHG